MTNQEKERPKRDREPEEPDYNTPSATVEACFESLKPNLKSTENVHFIADHDSKAGSKKSN